MVNTFLNQLGTHRKLKTGDMVDSNDSHMHGQLQCYYSGHW
jgi:hypothetical protein